MSKGRAKKRATTNARVVGDDPMTLPLDEAEQASLGSVMTCLLCGTSSDVEEEWGRTVKMRRSAGDGGQAVFQAVGDACGVHWKFFCETSRFFEWPKFCEKYHSDSDFQEEIDTACNAKMGASSRSSAVVGESGFLRESVGEKECQYIEVSTPSFHILTDADVKRETTGTTPKQLKMTSITLPKSDGSNETQEFFLVATEEPRYPTVRGISMIGTELHRPRMTLDGHKYKSQGNLLYSYLTHRRDDSQGHGALWTPSPKMASLDGLRKEAETLRSGKGHANKPPLSAPIGSPAKPAVPAFSPGGALKRSAPEELLTGSSPAPKVPRTAMEQVAAGSDEHPRQQESAGLDDSADEADIGDSVSQAGSGSAALAMKDPSQVAEDSLTDYWVKRNDLSAIMLGHALGVPEHQAELRLRKLVAHDQQNPHEQMYQSEITKLRSHLKKVTAAKRLVPKSILNLPEEDYQTVLMILGGQYAFPSATCRNMLLRKLSMIRRHVMSCSCATKDMWLPFVELLKPNPEGKEPLPFDPKNPAFAMLNMPAEEAAQWFQKEFVETTFIPVIDAVSERTSAVLQSLGQAVCEVFESFWVRLDDHMHRAVADLISGSRVAVILCDPSMYVDADLYTDMHGIQEAAARGSSCTLGLLGAAIVSHSVLGPRLDSLSKTEKHNMVAQPLFSDAADTMESYDVASLAIEHLEVLKKASELLVQWAPKLPKGVTKDIEQSTYERVFACGKKVLGILGNKAALSGASGEDESETVSEAMFGKVVEALTTATLYFSMDEKVVTLREELVGAMKGAKAALRLNDLRSAIQKVDSSTPAAGDEMPLEPMLANVRELYEHSAICKGSGLPADVKHAASGAMGKVVAILQKAPSVAMGSLVELLRKCAWMGAAGFAEECDFLLAMVEAMKMDVEAPTGGGVLLGFEEALSNRRLVMMCGSKLKAWVKHVPAASSPYWQVLSGKANGIIDAALRTEVEKRKQKVVDLSGKADFKDWMADIAKSAALDKVLKAFAENGRESQEITKEISQLEQAIFGKSRRCALSQIVLSQHKYRLQSSGGES